VARAAVTAVSGDSATFLSALARRIGTRVAVFVPRHRVARVLWFTDDRDETELPALTAAGRALLARVRHGAATGRTDGETEGAGDGFAAPGMPPTHASVAVALARSSDGELIGAVVAAKDPDREWTRAESALLEFAVDFHRTALVRCASRPLPSPTVEWFRTLGAADADLAKGMRGAAGRGELFLLYQPEIDLETGDVIAVEALSRWLHPRRGELGPDSFIALAEQSDLIQVLGAWVIEESFRDFGSWLHALPGLDLTLRINVSPTQIARPGFASLFAAALRRHGVPGERICIELTETTAVPEAAPMTAALADLRALGVQSAIDDLGSGYSSLNRLRALPVDLVKLDRGLVAGLDADDRAQRIVRGIVRMADDLGLAVIAEGVETVDELDALVRLGCRSAQGHYFGRPMTAASLVDYLREAGAPARAK